jgi:hypothetical protein
MLNEMEQNCEWPCPNAIKEKVIFHLVKSLKIHNPTEPNLTGLESLVIHKLMNRADIQLSFRMEKRYGLALMTIRDFLELEYNIVDKFSNEKIRDRVWIKNEVSNLSDFCLVPKAFTDELEIIRNFKNRCSTKNK